MASVAKRAGRANEDSAGAVPSAAVVIDGAGIPGTERICRHGVAWYAHRLGGSLLGLLPLAPELSLPALLAEAIGQVADAHRDTCDVGAALSPSATVAVLRLADGVADYLVLGDTFVVLDRSGREPLVVTDPREPDISRPYRDALQGVAEGSGEYRRILRDLRSHRNQPGGFWLAKDDPRAADEAVTGSCPVSELSGAVLLSNGAARIAQELALTDWPGALSVLASGGPAEVVRRVREAEVRQAVAPDDATVVHCTGLGEA